MLIVADENIPLLDAFFEGFGEIRRVPGRAIDRATVSRYLGDKFVRGYVAVKRAEHENFKRVISSWEREFLLLSV